MIKKGRCSPQCSIDVLEKFKFEFQNLSREGLCDKKSVPFAQTQPKGWPDGEEKNARMDKNVHNDG